MASLPAEGDAVRTTCPYCGVGCGVIASRDPSGAIEIRGDPAHPANRGRLCSKGAALGETLLTQGRLRRPMVDGEIVSWAHALDQVADALTRTIAEHGEEAVAFYVSGQLLNEDYYVANKLMKGYVGTANIDTNSRLCMASSVAGHRRAFGSDTVPGTYQDLELASLIVLVGSNLAWCHPVLFQRIAAAKAERPDMQIVVIDPRETATSEFADLHLAVRPDSDVVLFSGLLAYLADEDCLDNAYIAAHVDGAADAIENARQISIETVAALTGIAQNRLLDFYARFAATAKCVTVYSQGVNQSVTGTDKVNAIINCHLVTGRIGRSGQGPFSVTGQPNAMGGREVGGLANQLACHMDLDDTEHRNRVQRYWDSPRIASKPGLKAVDLFDACRDGRIRFLWIMATNPADSLPRSFAVEEAIRRCPYVVVSDVTAETDTARHARVLLPAAAWGEKDGTVTNSERCISRQRAFQRYCGEARPDWWIVKEVADRMGYGDAFAYTSADEIFREYAGLSAFENGGSRDFDIGGLDHIDANLYARLEPVQWPVRARKDSTPDGEKRFFADGGFYTANRRARCIAVPLPAARIDEDPAYPLVLNSGRTRDQWHTMTRTGLAPRLSTHVAEPFVEIHPSDAQHFGIAAADLVRIESADAHVIVRALVTERQLRGVLFVPMHWNDQFASNARVNGLVPSNVDRWSGQPALKSARVRIARVETAWCAFVVAATRPWVELADYWALARTGTGWRAELAGLTTPPDWREFVRRMLRLPRSDLDCLIEYHDRSRDIRRYAVEDHGLTRFVAYFAPTPVAASRQWVIDAYAATESPDANMLAGRPAAGSVDPGPIVCSCHTVGSRAILRAIVEERCTTVDAVGDLTSAGTNCGSCRAEIKRLLRESALDRVG